MLGDFVVNFIFQVPYVGLFGVLLIAGLGVPLPEDIPLLAAGWIVHRGHAELIPMMAVGLLGVLTGDFIIFSAGRRYGEHIIEHRWLRRIASPALILKAEKIFERHGEKIIFAARFMPGLRAVMFMVAGIFRVRPVKFLLIDGAAAILSVPLWVWLGAKFGEHAEKLAGDAQRVAFAALGIALAGWIVWEYISISRRRRIEAAAKLDAAELLHKAAEAAAHMHPVESKPEAPPSAPPSPREVRHETPGFTARAAGASGRGKPIESTAVRLERT